MSTFFWDFDGTLVVSNSLWSNSVFTALNDTLQNHGIAFADIRKHMAHGFTWHTPYNDYSDMTNDKWWDFMNRHFFETYTALGVESVFAQKAVPKIRDIIKRKENYILYPDAIDTLKMLKEAGHKNILLSNNYPDLPEVLKKLCIDKYFDSLVISAIEGYDKPRKEIFDKAKSLAEKDEKMYMIGDSENADIIGGHEAGMITVYVHRGHSEYADFCFESLSEIPKLVNP